MTVVPLGGQGEGGVLFLPVLAEKAAEDIRCLQLFSQLDSHGDLRELRGLDPDEALRATVHLRIDNRHVSANHHNSVHTIV